MPAINLSERERNLGLVTLGFVIFFVFYQFLLMPKWGEISRLKEKARAQRLELKVAEGKIKIIEAIEKKVGALPKSPEVSQSERALEVLKNLSQATAKSGLNLVAIKPIIEAGKEELKFNLSCTGKYQNLYNFLKILHGLRIVVIIDNLYVTGGGSERPILNVEMTLKAY